MFPMGSQAFLRFFYISVLLFMCSYNSVESKKRKNPQNDFKLTFLHNNDMHSRFEEIGKLGGPCKRREKESTGCYGGFARTAFLIEKFRELARSRKENPVTYLNAGDTFQGTPWFNIHKWKAVTNLLNRLKPDAASLGNHEFDDGVPGLVPYLNSSTYPILAANLNIDNEPTMQNKMFKKSQVFHIMCHKIGVIGYLTPETKSLSSKQNNIDFEDEVKAITREIKRLKRQNVRIFVALGHSGYITDQRIAKEVRDLDLVIGGHTNTFLWTGPQPDVEKVEAPYPVNITNVDGRLVYVVQAFAHTKYLGILNTTISKEGEITKAVGQPVLIDEPKEQLCSMANSVEVYRDEVEAETLEVVGRSQTVLPVQTCRSSECPLGVLLVNAFLRAYDGDAQTYGPAVIINGGALRAPLDASFNEGKVTHEMLLGIQPFGSMLMTGWFKGEIIKKALEFSVRRYVLNNPFGEFAHMTNLKVTYDMAKQNGSRVTKIEIKCTKCDNHDYHPLNDSDSYLVLTSSYLMNGGDGYSLLKDNVVEKTNLGVTDLAALKSYVKEKSPITKNYLEELSGKINMVNMDALYN